MPITARVYITHSQFRVTPTVRALRSPSLQVVSDARTDPENDVYFFLVGNDREPFERALADDPTVADANRLSAFEGKQLYRLTYADSALLISPTVTEVGGLTLEATAAGDGWLFAIQMPDRDALSALWNHATDLGLTWDLDEVSRRAYPEVDRSYGLTDTQRETLLTALGQGYFDEPRQATLADVADALNISQAAAGGRLRRGMERLIQATLHDES
ncbi:MAG: helix-turn-helix domain-containing protein [Salinirussus sp.]